MKKKPTIVRKSTRIIPCLLGVGVLFCIATAMVVATSSTFTKSLKQVLGLSTEIAGLSASGTGPIYWGAYIDGSTYGAGYGTAPWDNNTLNLFETHSGKKSSIVSFSIPWYNARANPSGYQQFPARVFDLARNHGSIPMMTWGSWDYNYGPNQADFALRNIAQGSYVYKGQTFDQFVTQFARSAKAWGHPFLLRFNWEMNGWWQFPWASAVNPSTHLAINGNTPADYVAAWKHVHDIFVREGAVNANWVWCPNVTAGNATVPLKNLYPGDSYVDWTCLDGYNKDLTTVTMPDGHKEMKYWLSFDDVFLGSPYNGNKNSYQEMLTVAPTKPIMIGEFASDESGDGGAKKAVWITTALGNLQTKYPMIRAILWFNWNSDTGSSYVVESSQRAQHAWATALQSSYFATNIFGSLSDDKVSGWPKGSPTPAASPTIRPGVTPTPRATSTPLPSATPTSSATPTPTSTPGTTLVPVQISSPVSGSTVTAGTLLTVTAPGRSEIANIEMYANDVKFCYKTNSRVFSCNLNVPATARGVVYRLKVKSVDYQGRSAWSDEVSVTAN